MDKFGLTVWFSMVNINIRFSLRGDMLLKIFTNNKTLINVSWRWSWEIKKGVHHAVHRCRFRDIGGQITFNG